MITHTNQNQTKDYILPVLAIVLSLGALSGTYDLSNIFSLIISLAGIAAGISFFTNKKVFTILIQVWIYGQFPAILFNEIPLFDGGQLFKFPIGVTLDTNSGKIDLYLNLIPIVYLTMFKLFKVSGLVGNKVTITKFRQDNKLGEIFPLTGTVLKRVQLEKDKFWIMVRLDKVFNYGSDSFNHMLLKSKDDQIYKPGNTEYISYLRLVKDPLQVTEKIENQDNFPFVDWGIVQVTK